MFDHSLIKDQLAAQKQACVPGLVMATDDLKWALAREQTGPEDALGQAKKSLIHAHVIHSHELRKGCGCIGIAWPEPADRHIHDEKERLVKWIVL